MDDKALTELLTKIPTPEILMKEATNRHAEFVYALVKKLVANFKGLGRIECYDRHYVSSNIPYTVWAVSNNELREAAKIFESLLHRQGWHVKVVAHPRRWWRDRPFVRIIDLGTRGKHANT